jgi:hypothetical protein
MAATHPSPLRLLNRELGLLAFNERVLSQAEDSTVPLLERLRYLTIVSNNLVVTDAATGATSTLVVGAGTANSALGLTAGASTGAAATKSSLNRRPSRHRSSSTAPPKTCDSSTSR